MMTRSAATEPFVHPALFYRGEQEYLEGTVPFIRSGLKDGEPVAVAVPGPNLAILKETLGADAGSVRFIDMTEAGRNPGRIIPNVLGPSPTHTLPRGSGSSGSRSGPAAAAWSTRPAPNTRR